MAFERFTPQRIPSNRLLSGEISIRRNGSIGIPIEYQEQLGDRVDLFYDAKTRRVAIKKGGGSGTFSLKQYGAESSMCVFAKRFFEHHGIEIGAALRYPVLWDPGHEWLVTTEGIEG